MRPVPVLCDRCGVDVNANWIDITSWADRDRAYCLGRIECPMPGCVDEDGSPSVLPPDGYVRGLLREDLRWLKEQDRFIRDYESVARAFRAALAEVNES